MRALWRPSSGRSSREVAADVTERRCLRSRSTGQPHHPSGCEQCSVPECGAFGSSLNRTHYVRERCGRGSMVPEPASRWLEPPHDRANIPAASLRSAVHCRCATRPVSFLYGLAARADFLIRSRLGAVPQIREAAFGRDGWDPLRGGWTHRQPGLALRPQRRADLHARLPQSEPADERAWMLRSA
jgi:hypothetical protein